MLLFWSLWLLRIEAMFIMSPRLYYYESKKWSYGLFLTEVMIWSDFGTSSVFWGFCFVFLNGRLSWFFWMQWTWCFVAGIQLLVGQQSKCGFPFLLKERMWKTVLIFLMLDNSVLKRQMLFYSSVFCSVISRLDFEVLFLTPKINSCVHKFIIQYFSDKLDILKGVLFWVQELQI